MPKVFLFVLGGLVGWAASGLYMIPAHRAREDSLAGELQGERCRRVMTEIDADGRRRDHLAERWTHSVEIDRLRRELIRRGDPAGALPVLPAGSLGPDEVPVQMIPPQSLPTTPGDR